MSKKRSHFWLDFFACFLIPAYTLLFAGSTTWFGTNFSVIAVTGADHYRGFVYWGILSGSYFFVMLSRLAFTLPARWQRGLTRLLAVCAGLSLAYAVAIPYLPAYFPKYAALHVALAAGACVLLMVNLQFIILVHRRRDRARWAGPMRFCGFIVIGCAVLFLIPMMVSTALEVFFTISAALLARRIWLLTEF
ncbi:hypothetical protein D1641_04755 [Colidextribacter sp. OB.20]|uniref:hypothetical protein n=1 Tax=Colidextribacter sp. OB.20 TaxID=2304568 RepID=UPI001370DFDD|nr:hypothetical protein [Colidextribacter sp. OB.20]NBI09330.1 hypothetical protein [Colidextribacter sp. OB.20]